MIPYSYNMVDMGGIDLAEANGTVVEGLYNRLALARNACGDLILYNWKFAEIEIVPGICATLDVGSSILINGLIQVTEQDEVSIPGIAPIPVISPLPVTENGVYTPPSGVDGYAPVTVNVSRPWNDNFAVNWDFANAVNTRGQASYSTQSLEIETIDGWMIQNGVVELENDGIRISRRSGYSGDAYFQQHFSTKGSNFCYGVTITLSIIFDGDLYSVTFTAPSSTGIYADSIIHLGENTDLAIVYFSNSTTIEFFLRDDAKNHVVNAIKLEVGSQQTLATQNAETGVWVLNKTMIVDDERVKRKIMIN